jgi:hypothetical protein
MTQETTNIVIGFGHEEGGVTQSPTRAWSFRSAIRDALAWEDITIDATITGRAFSAGWGKEPATWIAATIPTSHLPALRCALRVIGKRFRQDAIALTFGTCEIIECGGRK